MSARPLSRRSMLGLAGLGIGELALAACSSSKPRRSSGPSASSGSAAPGSASTAPTSAVPVTSEAPGSASAVPSGSAPATASPTKPRGAGRPVHVRLYQADGATYGVGLPIIAYLSRQITDASEFARVTTVTADGRPVEGSWNFRPSAIYSDYPLEAHYRPRSYWPAHAAIALDLPIKDLSAGKGLHFDDSLTLAMRTGARNITRVDGRTLKMVVTSDGRHRFTFPVSLGAADTPTYEGIKIVMARNRVERMVSHEPGHEYDLRVPWSVRLTNSGEFIHSASWNTGNIGERSTSHGCTNLDVDDAEKYYRFARVGDVTEYTHTGGRTMPAWDGYGDWNVPWATWIKGGAVPLR